MKVNFVALGDVNLASHRFRVLKPYEILNDLNVDVTIKKFPDLKADINVFQKHMEPEMIIQWLLTKSTKTVFDVCDDHFDRELGSYYKQVCSLADILTCTNKRMEKRLKQLFPNKPVKVFHDPVNTTPSPFKAPVERPKVIWFGHASNFEEALPWLKEAVSLDLDVTVFSNLNIKGGDFTFVPFQPGWLEDNLKNYDIVLLPTGNQPWVNMKSENRFVDALNAGCCVITNNNILYKDLVNYGIYETGSISKALEKYQKGQYAPEGTFAFLEEKYNDKVIKNQWKTILDLN